MLRATPARRGTGALAIPLIRERKFEQGLQPDSLDRDTFDDARAVTPALHGAERRFVELAGRIGGDDHGVPHLARCRHRELHAHSAFDAA